MWQAAVRPRNLALLLLACVLTVIFGMLARWQWGVAGDHARSHAQEEQAARPPVDLTTVMQPHQPFPRGHMMQRVTVQGHYAADGQVLVPDRRLEGRTGYWVITPLVVDATGARLPVLRGFVETPAQAGPPSTGPITLHGSLAASESPPDTITQLPPGQLGSVDAGSLVNSWGGEMIIVI